MNRNVVPNCRVRPIALGGDYQLTTFNCEPANKNQPEYLIGSTGEDETSFYLFKTEYDEHYSSKVEAFVSMSQDDLYYLKQRKRREKRRKFKRFLHDLTLGVLYNSHNF